MENKISLLGNAIENIKNASPIIAGLLAIALAISLYFGYSAWNKLQESLITIQQQNDYLLGNKSEIQKINNRLGLAESVVTQKENIIKDYQKTVKELNIELDKIKGSSKVKPSSKDTTIVVIKDKTIGGNQSIEIKDSSKPEVVSYNWSDSTGRFRLLDPDIKTSGNEVFEYKLKLKITGFILKDPSGSIQARQVVAQEVYQENGKNILGPPLEIENNIYEYSVEKPEKNIFQIIRPRLYFLFDTNLDPGFGLELVNLGNYFDYINIGMGPFISIETDNFPNDISATRLGFGTQYLFVPPLLSTNIGIGFGVSTPLNNFTKEIIVSGYLLFYITN